MKRTLSLVLSFCLVLSLFTGILVSGAGAITYSDVPQDFWAYNEIYYLTEKNILQGDGTGKFRPKDSVTHIEFIKMIVATFNLTDAVTVNYTNIPQWAREGRYVEKAAAQGFLLSSYTKDFDFTTKLKREEAVALIMRYLDLDPDYAVSSSRYPDYNKISSAYREYALIATGAGIIQGDDTGNFQPDRILTRSEALRILYTAAGAIYDKSANRAETGANKTNATINHSVNLSGINFTGNVYISEGASNVTLTDCYINGELIVRGKTSVTLDDTIASNVRICDSGSALSLKDESVVTTCNVDGTANISVDEKASIQKLLLNGGSKNSTVTGKGVVTNVAVNDSGITLTGVDITEYYVYRGYTVTIDGVVYQAGSGKPVKNGISSAFVSGALNGSVGYMAGSSTISVVVTTNAAGTVYVAAWPITEKALDAGEIRNALSSTAANHFATSQSVIGGVATTIPLAVSGSYESYNVGIVFVPSGGTTTVANLTPYYNKSAITTVSTAMGTTAPASSTSAYPTWTAAIGSQYNTVIISYNQAMGYKTSNNPVTVAELSTIGNTRLAGCFTIKQGSTAISVTNATYTTSTTGTVVYLTLGKNLENGKTYTVTVNSAITNKQGLAPSKLSADFTVGSGSTTAMQPTLTSSSGSQNVTYADYIQIGFPEGVTRVSYTVTCDGVQKTSSYRTSNYGPEQARISLYDYREYNVIVISAWSMSADGKTQLSQPVTQTYFMGDVPVIYVDGNPYYGESNVIYLTGTYYITTYVPAGYTAYYYDGTSYGSTAPFDGAKPAPSVTTSTTYTIRMLGGSTEKVVSVTIYFGSNSGSYGSDPIIYINNVPYTGTGNTVYVTGSYTVGSYVPSGYTATYYEGTTYSSTTKFDGAKPAPAANVPANYTITLAGSSKQVSVSVYYGSAPTNADPIIYINGTAYYPSSAGNVAYVNGNYSVNSYIPVGFTANYAENNGYGTTYSFDGNKTAPASNSYHTYRIEITRNGDSGVYKSVEVRVYYSSSTTPTSYDPIIYINGTAYTGTSNTIYLNTNYIVASYVPSGYTATYYKSTSSYGSSMAFDGTYSAPSQNNGVTYTITITGYGITKSVSVSIYYGNGGSGGSGSGSGTGNIDPTVSTDNHANYWDPGIYNDVTGTSKTVTIFVPNNGLTYTYVLDGSQARLTNGKDNTVTVNGSSGVTKTLQIVATSGSEVKGSWAYYFVFR